MKYTYTQAVLKFLKLNTQAQQREAVVQGRSLSPYRLRYNRFKIHKTEHAIAKSRNGCLWCIHYFFAELFDLIGIRRKDTVKYVFYTKAVLNRSR
ncbi:MAG: hypothetical protein LBJ00_09735 [Planctomycetaceae bacterium]|jgi:hypothetical protein|nr:hypothetical protein [Planctomycetaceae bacterium]